MSSAPEKWEEKQKVLHLYFCPVYYCAIPPGRTNKGSFFFFQMELVVICTNSQRLTQS